MKQTLRKIKYAYSNGNRYSWYQCVCGELKVIRDSHVRSQAIKSCGCLVWKHGKCSSITYKSWDSMKERCHNRQHKSFKNYGGRGIKVCARWIKSFENFYLDMGRRPSRKYSLDRIDGDGNYTPGNCRWVTMKQQANNRR